MEIPTSTGLSTEAISSEASRDSYEMQPVLGSRPSRPSEGMPIEHLTRSEPSQAMSEEDAAVVFQKAVRGQQARKSTQVKSLAPGVTHVHVRGDSEVFNKVGIDGINDKNGNQNLNYVKVSGNHFSPHVVGGESLHQAVPSTSKTSAFGALAGEKIPDSSTITYVNGGFYNRFNPKFPDSTADKSLPEHATIGKTKTSDGSEPPFIAPPELYKDKYHSLAFPDGSVATAGPVLAKDGEPTFTAQDMQQDRFKYNPNNITPGLLNHAEHPNPRTSVIAPDTPGEDANYRLAIGSTTTTVRGAGGTGFTMPEWSRVNARLSRLDRNEQGQVAPSVALNMDGGVSTVLGVDHNQEKLLDVRQAENTKTPFLVALSNKTE